MSRTSVAVTAALVLLGAIAIVALGRGASADAAKVRIAYLYVSGTGPQAKAWYDGGPPAGVQVQSALDRFTNDGYHFAAISSSGRTAPAGGSAEPRAAESAADYVILLER